MLCVSCRKNVFASYGFYLLSLNSFNFETNRWFCLSVYFYPLHR